MKRGLLKNKDNALLKVTIPSIKNKESSEKFLSLLQNMFDLKVCSRKSTIIPVLYDVNHTSGKIDFLFKALCENEDVSKLDFEKTLRSYDLMIT